MLKEIVPCYSCLAGNAAYCSQGAERCGPRVAGGLCSVHVFVSVCVFLSFAKAEESECNNLKVKVRCFLIKQNVN